jgi:Ca-activated chloride channel family protein
MHYKKSFLILAIASITACSQYQTEQPKIVETEEQKFEVELLDSDSITATGYRKENRMLPLKAPRVARQKTHKTKGIILADSIAYSAPMQLSVPNYNVNRENYKNFKDNKVKITQNEPVSTFSIDVDTGAYSNMRRLLNQGQIPPKDAIRVEELINYFNYNYPLPEIAQQPFSVSTELAPSPWNSNAKLLHLGIQGYKVENQQRPASNLTFLVDVSGSMSSADKLGLLKSSFKLLTKNLRAQDRVAIVVYAGAAGTVLESTPGNQKSKILQALDKLSAGGSTNGAAGIKLAYQIAEDNFIKGGINRVIIATDGDFNVGTTNFEQLKELAERKRQSGVSLTTLGFGTGNYNDALMEQLADAGNGNYAYIDTLKEANKVLILEMSSTLMTIAKDVKIQIEFNPAIVSQYRLIGYENRLLNNEDFNNDKIDAGEIGAGHSVTALYEIVLTGSQGWLEPLKYQPLPDSVSTANELATLKIRYKQPDADISQLIVSTINKSQLLGNINQTSNNFKLSAAVAAFGQLLRGAKMTNNFSYADIRKLARDSAADDRYGYRGEFIQLLTLAESLTKPLANNVE